MSKSNTGKRSCGAPLKLSVSCHVSTLEACTDLGANVGCGAHKLKETAHRHRLAPELCHPPALVKSQPSLQVRAIKPKKPGGETLQS
eukprot:3608533-Rhodomonas_salina.2